MHPQDDHHFEVVQGEGPSADQVNKKCFIFGYPRHIIIFNYQQRATAEEATESPYDHEVFEENQEDVATAYGNDEVVFQEQVRKLNINISVCSACP